MFESISETSVLVAALLAVAVGHVWYSELFFGKAWSREHARLDGGMLTTREVVWAVTKSIGAQCLFFYVLALLFNHITETGLTIKEVGAGVAALVAVQMVSVAVWERRSVMYMLGNIGYVVAVTYGGLAVIAYWPW
jgi:hypothetical protein